jgi:hypothetical protein
MLESLRTIVREAGVVKEVYGGYEIMVDDVDNFPWYKICDLLLDSSFEVWMRKSGTKLLIMSKPAVD